MSENAETIQVQYTKTPCEKIEKEQESEGSDLLTPFGEDIEAEHALLGLDEVLEDVNLLLGIRLVGIPGFLDELLEGEVGFLGGTADQGGELHRLLP